MTDTASRLLQLLSLLQRRRHWSGPELAERLGVTTRTVRRDVDRLRGLGYPVEAGPGVTGGYELGVGGTLPPLLLDDDEATAVAVGLSAASGAAVEGVELAAVAALAKIDRLLPPRVRARVEALRAATVSLAVASDPVEAGVLVDLAHACDGNERIVIEYRDRDGRESERRVEPYRLVATGRRWYLAARDVDRDGWRTFRVDRMGAVRRTGHRFVPGDAPDIATLVSTAISTAPYRYQARVVVDAPPERVARHVPPTAGVVRALGDGRTELTTGGDDLVALAGHLVWLGCDFEVVEPVELRDHLRRLGRMLARAHARAGGRAERGEG